MKGIRKNLILSLFLLLSTATGFCAENDESVLIPSRSVEIHNEPKKDVNSNYFNLANIVDNFFTRQDDNINKEDDKPLYRKDFISASAKFNQGNAKNAYDGYEILIDKIDNDIPLLTLSKVFYEIGFFSLSDKAIDKIAYKNQYQDNISDLDKSYKPKALLSKEEEIYFAKIYSSIYFDNSALETIVELNAKKEQYNKNDFYWYYLARAYYETKQYGASLNAINKALILNQDNISYQVFKINALIGAKKYKDAKNLIEKLEKNKTLITYQDKIEILKQTVLASLEKNDKEKKYYIANKSFLEGNYEKVKKDCENILNFDKDNDKILSLYAKNELALGNIERANHFFVNSYKIEKNNLDTLIGLGDIRYIHGDYKNSVKMYKKALKYDKTNYEIIIKLALAQRQYAKNQKELKKLENRLDRMPKGDYLSYYKSALSIANKNSVLKEDFIKRVLLVNPLYENAIGELIDINLKNKNYIAAKGLIQNAGFTMEKNYYYYYLCGLYNQAMDKNREAIQFYKTSLNLNSNFEAANTKLLKLIPDKINEEI